MCAGREKIADASGKSVVVEYIGSEMNVVYPVAEGYQAATNFLLTPGDFDFGKGQDRYQTIMEQLAASKGVLNEQQAMDVLKSVSREIRINEDGEEFRTQWPILYNQDRATAKICVGGDYGQTREFKVKE